MTPGNGGRKHSGRNLHIFSKKLNKASKSAKKCFKSEAEGVSLELLKPRSFIRSVLQNRVDGLGFRIKKTFWTKSGNSGNSAPGATAKNYKQNSDEVAF